MPFDYWLYNHYNKIKEVVIKMQDKISMYKKLIIMPIEEERNFKRKYFFKE